MWGWCSNVGRERKDGWVEHYLINVYGELTVEFVLL